MNKAPNTNKTLCETCIQPVSYSKDMFGRWCVACACHSGNKPLPQTR